MKEIVQYKCEICGTNYSSADKCRECEAFHINVASVDQYKYNSKGMGPESKYPHAVVVIMADGNRLTFKR